MTKRSSHSPRTLLDRRAEALGQRHQARLEAMTRVAVDAAARPRARSAWRTWPLAAAGIAASIVLAATLVVFSPSRQTPPTRVAKPTPSLVPAWVEDDSVPVSVLENIEFYVWVNQSAEGDQQG